MCDIIITSHRTAFFISPILGRCFAETLFCVTTNKRNVKRRPNGVNMIDSIDPLWLNWFVGFVDGEGYFQASKKKPNGYQIDFVLDLREDDHGVLEEIQRMLRCGYLYRVSKQYDRLKSNRLSSDHAKLMIRKHRDIEEIVIPIFDRYPLKTKKQKDYRLWREIFYKYKGIKGMRNEIEIHKQIDEMINYMKFIRMGQIEKDYKSMFG